MSYCNGCGGLVGRDCFNPQECEWITLQMNSQPDDSVVEELKRLLNESTAVLEWHLSKSQPLNEQDQSDFFHMTVNAIESNKKAILGEEPDVSQEIDFDNLPF